MIFKLDATHDKYIRITVSGLIVKSELITAIAQLMQHPDYLKKHSFWDFKNAQLGMSIVELKEIIGILKLYKPKQKNASLKSALLLSGNLNSAMAGIFVAMAKLLPFEYQIFKDEDGALSFLLSP